MSSISTAVGLERRARVSGYKIKKGFFSNVTQNLPQVIAVFGEANTANQTGLTTEKREVTSAQEAAELYGYGSPIHIMMRILRPISGDGVGGIPTVVYPQISDVAAVPSVQQWTISGTATGNGTHNVVINGRSGLDFQNYSYSVITGDTPTQIASKIADSINGVLSSPVTASAALDVVTITTKWSGTTASELDITFDVSNSNTGVSYSLTTATNGAGDVDLLNSFTEIGEDWVTCIINPYGISKLDQFEQFNGKPDPDNPTGRYSGIIFKPFLAFFGSKVDRRSSLLSITNVASRINEVTNVLCPAPRSNGWSMEAAANVVSIVAPISQNTPHLSYNNKEYPDMPLPNTNPNNIGDMAEYNNRDVLVKGGCSTVILDNGAYTIQDLVNTYHPEGENPLQFNYVRNLILDWNVADTLKTLEKIRLQDKTLVRNGQVVAVSGTITPSQWKAVLFDMFDNLAENALINEPDFSKDNLEVQISEINPNRFETRFKYKRTGVARIESTTAIAGF